MTAFLWNIAIWEWVVAALVVIGGWLWRHDRAQLMALYDKWTTPAERSAIDRAAHELAPLIQLVHTLAPDAVLFIEHAMPGTAGALKFTAAVERIVAILASHGITASASLQSIVEAAVQAAYATVLQNGTLATSAGGAQA